MSLRLPFGMRQGAAALFCAAVLAAAPLGAQDLSPFGDPDERQERLEPPLPLPDGLRGTVRPQENPKPLQSLNRIRDVFETIQACWRPPSDSGYSGQEITIRMSFKRNGEVFGRPRITYYKAGANPDQREPFTRSVREAFERCAPLPFTQSLGAAVAGRPFIFRFIDARPM